MNKTVLLTLLCFVLCGSSFARNTQLFNDGWLFKKGTPFTDPVTFAASLPRGWNLVSIPHTWNAVDMQVEKNSYYAGEAFYKKSYTPSVDLADKRIFLRFEGVASTAEVYVNGVHAATHKGGYSAFAVEITHMLNYGKENEIMVKANNASRPDVIPINHTLFGVYGGIYRDVELIITDKLNIAVTDYASPGVYIRQGNVTAKSAEVGIEVKLENRYKTAKNVQLSATIIESDGKVKVRQEKTIAVLPQGRQSYTLDLLVRKPHLWQGLEDPYLYKVVTQVVLDGKVIDQVIQPLGLRHFELIAGVGMLLNGKKVPMYGVCRHQDWWQRGSALTNKEHDQDLEMIREIGATTIRFAHYQQAEHLYAKCDSIGFIIWAEIPFVNRVSTQEADNAKQQLTELIRQNYNHPSIYTWGLHNEVYSPANYTSSLTVELNDLAKSEDPDRYTVSVSGYSQVDRPANLHADLQGINHYFGWYDWKDSARGFWEVEDWVVKMEKDFPNHKVIFSEYGAEANIAHQQEIVPNVGNCCGYDKKYNETFATKFHEAQWSVIAKHPYLLASYVWNMFDFATPASAQGGVMARNMKGLVTFDRKVKKDPFYWYKANWSKEPVLYLTQRRAVERENQNTQVVVYSNIGTPKLMVNNIEVKDHKQGTTHVHYVFENVQLRPGKNLIQVEATHQGKSYVDAIEWNYLPANKSEQGTQTLRKSTEQHVGL